MKIVRIQSDENEQCYAIVQADGRLNRASGDIYKGLVDTGQPASGKILAPIVPGNILCIGLNYRDHAKEANLEIPEHPVLFIKMSSCLQNPDDPILLPRVLNSSKVDYEAELAVVIGKSCHNVNRAEAMDYVLGYTCANDISARDWQKHGGGGQWCRGKSFSTFCPLGPVLVTADDIPDPNKLSIQCRLNGELVQDGHTSNMIFDVPSLIEFLSGSSVLPAGTVILTGTPHGVGFARKPPVFLQPGDTVSVAIENIGVLKNHVAEEAVSA